MSYVKHSIVYINPSEKKKNNYLIKEFFSLDVLVGVIPTDPRHMREYEEFIGDKYLRYYATMSKDSRYVAILVKEEKGKNYFLLEVLPTDVFTVTYKTINNKR